MLLTQQGTHPGLGLACIDNLVRKRLNTPLKPTPVPEHSACHAAILKVVDYNNILWHYVKFITDNFCITTYTITV